MSCKIKNWWKSVFVQKCPGESQALLKYMQTVRTIAFWGGNFRKYDETLRRLRQTTLVAWDTLHPELYCHVAYGRSGLVATALSCQPAVTKRFLNPLGLLHQVSQRGVLWSCKYKHLCFICGEDHQHCKCPNKSSKSVHNESANPQKVYALDSWLMGFHNCETLVNQFQLGFPLRATLLSDTSTTHNHCYVEHPDVVSVKLDEEVQAGLIAGPFPTPPFKPIVTSPLGVVPKKIAGLDWYMALVGKEASP